MSATMSDGRTGHGRCFQINSPTLVQDISPIWLGSGAAAGRAIADCPMAQGFPRIRVRWREILDRSGCKARDATVVARLGRRGCASQVAPFEKRAVIVAFEGGGFALRVHCLALVALQDHGDGEYAPLMYRGLLAPHVKSRA